MKRLFTLFLATSRLLAQSPAPDFDRAIAFTKTIEGKVFRAEFTVHWQPDGQHCWYRVQVGPRQWENVLVDVQTGRITRGADAAHLDLPATKLTTSKDTTTKVPASGRAGEATKVRFTNRTTSPVELFWIDPQSQRKSYGQIAPGESRELGTFAGHAWLIADERGGTLGTVIAAADPIDLTIDGPGRTAEPDKSRAVSPDGQWQVRFEQNQIVLRNTATNESSKLTNDGTVAQPYRGSVSWAPDGQSFVVLQVNEVPVRKVTLIESRPAGQTQPKVHTFDYAKPGDELPRPRPVLVRLADRKPIAIDSALFPNPFTPNGSLDVRWSPRSDEFYFDYNQRGHQLWRILAVNAQNGAVRTVVEETSRTFIDYTHKTWRHWCDDSHELLWMSERDGWAHLWLYDAATGAVKNQITRGEWVVRKVEQVDEKQRQVWFLASGLRPGEDPYHQHLCRVNFDGSGFTRLTEGDGDHEIAFSPDRRFFTDRWSRADQPPITELRRSADGSLVCELERADASTLLATGWSLPERFVAKGRDGKTDIHGVIIKPSHFDPARSYPVLEEVYAGPHSAFAPKRFDPLARLHSLAELGFIVVKADGMGTNHRGKVFHDVAWKNLQDAGFPDRIAWIKAAAATRPWMDLSRVGIFGGSAGGQSAMRALLDHADFYQVAFADCGCHDNRIDKIWWNEQWLGWPVDESYVRASNVEDAAKLRGALMLCVGEIDRNVDPASTMQVVAALEKAGKPFDLLIVAGTGHGAAETPYGNRRRMEFFARHFLASTAPRPTRETRSISGWTVHISQVLLDTDRAATEHALDLLKAQLDGIIRLVPAKAVAELQKVPLYFSPEYSGVQPRAEYHPGAGWLRDHGRDPAMAKGIEFTNVRIFDAEVKRMPVFALHELAHAYHDRVLGFDQPEVLAAYQHARETKLYDAVERRGTNGRPSKVERAYAMTDEKEYFAETSEAFFGENDFFPFNRADLAGHDPEMGRLLARLWGAEK